MYARLRGSKSVLTLCQNINRPDFPSLADEIAEQHPDMNIKVAAFTVNEKSSNTYRLIHAFCPWWIILIDCLFSSIIILIH